MRRAPPFARDEVLDDRRPRGAGDVVAGRADGDRDAEAAPEPVGDIRHQRTKRGGAAEADQRVTAGKDPDVRRVTGDAVSEREPDGGAPDRGRGARVPHRTQAPTQTRPPPPPRTPPPGANPPPPRGRGRKPGAGKTENPPPPAGRATGKDHMPPPPMVASSAAMPRRSQ